MSGQLIKICRKVVKGMGAVGIMMMLVVGLSSDVIVFEEPVRQMARAKVRISERLTKRNGVHFLVAFDEVPPIEWVSGMRLLQSGVYAVPGSFGQARRFIGHHRVFIASERNWADLGNQFTISTWIMLDEAPAPQTIVYAHHDGGIGLTLEDGHLTFRIPGGSDQKVAYPFAAYGQFVHITAVADAHNGHASLYENGHRMASAPLSAVKLPDLGIGISQRRGYSCKFPLHGSVGETVVWNRSLSEKEIRAHARRRRSLLPQLGGFQYVRLRFFESIQQGLRVALKTFDAFNVFNFAGPAQAAIPELSIQVSNKARKRLHRGHEQSLRTGIRTDDAARSAKAAVVFSGKSAKGRLRLEAPAGAYGADTGRMAFVVSLEAPTGDGNLRHLRLKPPEAGGLLHPLLVTEIARRAGVPHVANGLCRLTLNGQFLGIYYFEDFERAGIFPGQWSEVFSGPTSPSDWRSNFRTQPAASSALSSLGNRSPFDIQMLHTMGDELEHRYAEHLQRDYRSPMSSREIRYRLRKAGEALPERFVLPAPDASGVRTAADLLTEFMLLGDNPSPFFIVGNLDLSAFSAPGFGITWRSATPELLSDAGEVRRPDGFLPAEAVLTAALTDGSQSFEKTLNFRIQPRTLAMPAVMLHVRDPIFKTRRADTLIDYYPAGSDGTRPQRFVATQSQGGGIAHRGNTAHWQHKKPFNLKFDDAHFLLGNTRTRHIHFTTAYRDQTFIRNKLAYDLFRSFSEPGAERHAPVILWAEVFANGTYYGLYELTTRIDRHMLDIPDYREGMAHPGELFKLMIQKHPPLYSLDLTHNYYNLSRTLKQLQPGVPLEAHAQHFDIANAVDFHLLLNVVEGIDNETANYFIARDPGPDEKYYFVAWDHKRGFRGGTRTYIHHFFSTIYPMPAFQVLLRDRWLELRRDRLEDRTVLDAIDRMSTQLAGYTDWEYERWGLNRGVPFDEQVATLKTNIARRLAFLDTQYGMPPAGTQESQP